MCTVGTNASIKEFKKVVIENIFGIPLMLCVCGFFLCGGRGFNFNFKIFRKFIQRNFLIKYIESLLSVAFLAVLFP